jgi:Zn-dependent protease with chaperone function
MYDAGLLEKLERELQENPKVYQSKVAMLAILGNAYIVFGIIVLLAILILACLSILVLKALAIKLIAVVGIFLYVVISSLWVRVDPPEGIKISKNEAPELFVIIDDLRKKLNSPNFHHVLMSNDFNAAVVQRPRLGLLGWYQNYLIIGLPLMQSLTVEQLTAVLAHEFGHLSKNHARTANWIYRQRIRWEQLFILIEQNTSKIDIIFRPFLKRFVPYFVAYSFPIARANEYEADKISVNLTSAEIVAETLTTVNVIGHYLEEEYWPRIFNQVETLPQPKLSPYMSYVQQLSEYVLNQETNHWLTHSLSMRTSFEDTHPSLSDRLSAIGQTAHVAFAAHGYTADRLLGTCYAEIVAAFDQNWQVAVQDAWQKEHKSVLERTAYLTSLNEKMDQQQDLSLEERFDQVLLTEQLAHQPEKAFELVQQLYQEFPEHPHTNFIYGRYYIEQKNPQGVVLLEKAIQLDEFAAQDVYKLLYRYYDELGDTAKAEKYQQLLTERADLEYKALTEREHIGVSDPLIAHGLTQEQLADFSAQIQRFSNIKQVWLIKKKTQFLPHIACYVMAFSLKQGILDKVSEEAISQTMQILHEKLIFPGETFMICADLAEHKLLQRKIQKIQSSCILKR